MPDFELLRYIPISFQWDHGVMGVGDYNLITWADWILCRTRKTEDLPLVLSRLEDIPNALIIYSIPAA